MTRGDKIRNMTDEQIVDAAFDIGIDVYISSAETGEPICQDAEFEEDE